MKFYLTLLLCCVFFIAQAQESMKGYTRIDQLNGFASTYRSSKILGSRQNFGFSPTLAKFVGHKTLLGIDGNFSYFRLDNVREVYQGMSIYAAPFIRKYFGNRKLKPFAGAQYRIGFSNVDFDQYFELEDFDLDLEVGLAHFISKNLSIELAFDFSILYADGSNLIINGYSYYNENIATHAFGAWDFRYVPTISINANMYLPFSSKAIRSTINPLAYQVKGNYSLGIAGEFSHNIYNYVSPRTGGLSVNFARFLTNTWQLSSQARATFDRQGLILTNMKTAAKRFFELPLDNLQGFGGLQIGYRRNTYWDFTSRRVVPAYYLENRLEVGVQYALRNVLLKFAIGNGIHAAKSIDFETWQPNFVNDIYLEYERFWDEHVSFFASATVSSNSREIGQYLNLTTMIPSSRWQFGFGYRVYFVN